MVRRTAAKVQLFTELWDDNSGAEPSKIQAEYNQVERTGLEKTCGGALQGVI